MAAMKRYENSPSNEDDSPVFVSLGNPYEGSSNSSIPTGRWRSGICGCCDNGCCFYPMFWFTAFLSPLALGWVMTRNQLNACARVTNRIVFWTAFKVLAVVFVGYIIMYSVLFSVVTTNAMSSMPTVDENGNLVYPEPSSSAKFAGVLLVSLPIVFFGYLLVLLCRTRSYIRHKYQIPGGDVEDLCLSIWCSCCTILQVARHTNENDCCHYNPCLRQREEYTV